jgi:acyl-coenzyme A synthetase/AMP-(fatty) acid ligase
MPVADNKVLSAMLPGKYKVWVGKTEELNREIHALEILLKHVLSGEIEAEISFVIGEEENWIGNVFDQTASQPHVPYGLTVYSSGTTGRPKPINIDIRNRIRNTRKIEERVWLLCYPPGRWASLSMLIHTLVNNERLLIPDSFSKHDLIFAMKNKGVNSISLTPSLFKSLSISSFDDLSELKIQQVTFGGEYASQSVLDLAKKIWPNSSVTHVYASTEMGELLSENDGLEGFLVSKLVSIGGQIDEDGELIVSGFRTNDYWEVCDGRMIFIGRNSEIVTVGGFNVSLINVERALSGIAGVMDCSVAAVPSPLLGNILVATVVGDLTSVHLRKELSKIIPKHEIPAKIYFVDQISISNSMKKKRVIV